MACAKQNSPNTGDLTGIYISECIGRFDLDHNYCYRIAGGIRGTLPKPMLPREVPAWNRLCTKTKLCNTGTIFITEPCYIIKLKMEEISKNNLNPRPDSWCNPPPEVFRRYKKRVLGYLMRASLVQLFVTKCLQIASCRLPVL